MKVRTIGVLVIVAAAAGGLLLRSSTDSFSASASDTQSSALSSRVTPSAPDSHPGNSSRSTTALPGTGHASTTDATTDNVIILGCVAHSSEALNAPIDILSLPPGAVGIDPWRLKYFCPADFNRDNVIDQGDVALYLAVFAAREGPMVDWLDLTGDGVIDDADLDSFMRQYQDGGCDPEQAAEYMFIIC
ncbi:MAG: hypothetical protein HBSAPP03_29680 [Phycisphaerae bacterium]|nr:MAG: hypothetical protein HBSAPP03_29680 [Phycisphaerae bacterium]